MRKAKAPKKLAERREPPPRARTAIAGGGADQWEEF
jgi:hypothetical protein